MAQLSDLAVLKDVLAADRRVRLAVVFGSAARDTQRSGSDLDVGVLVEPHSEAGPPLDVVLARATGRTVDLVRLDTAPPLLRFEIARDGKVLVERVPHAWTDFRARAMTDWWEWAPTARMLHAAAVSRLRGKVPRGSL
jgi:predicted nucleotidyltransferase